MRLRDLEEFASLTPETVRAYLERTGWVAGKPGARGSCQWSHPDLGGRPGFLFDGAFEEGWAEQLIESLVLQLGRRPQAILREICPRMRKGCPNQAARRAHPGRWLAIDPSGAGYLVRFDERRGDDPGFEVYRSSGDGRPETDPFRNPGCSYNVSAFRGGLADWSFWPCDDHGNKVPLPSALGLER